MINSQMLAVLPARRGPGASWRIERAASLAALNSALRNDEPHTGIVWLVEPHEATIVDRPEAQLVVIGALRDASDQQWWPRNDARFERLATRLATDFAATLRDLRGPFLLAFLNRRTGEAAIAIDRFGVQSLCYATASDGSLVAASDATLLRQHPRLNPALDPQALYNFLYFHMVPSPGTVFRGVRKLEPAQYLRVREAQHNAETWWRPEFRDREVESEDALRAEMIPALTRAVKRSGSRPSPGTFLSGGIDSSTVTGLLNRDAGQPMPAYSMGFAADGYDEARYAQLAAKHFKANLRQFYVEPDQVAQEIFNVATSYDEPFGNSSAVPTLLCARYAHSEGTRTMLAGDGGDELFAGNERYAKQRVFEWYHGVPGALRSALIEPLLVPQGFWNAPWPVRKAAAYVRQARQPMPLRLQSYNFLNRTPAEEMFEGSFRSSIDLTNPGALLQSSWDDVNAKNLVDRMLHLDWKFTLADNDLRKVSRMCSLAGVEVHYPWLDEDVVDLSLRLPGDAKMRGLKLRTFAKQALTGFLPQEILDKTKHGFGLPFGEWLKTSVALQTTVYELLGRFKARGVVRPDFIDYLITQHREGHAAYYGSMVWVIAMLEAWLESHRLDVR